MRCALKLISSHPDKNSIGDLSEPWKEVLGCISRLSPKIRRYRKGNAAGLVGLDKLSVASEDTKGISLVVISYYLDQDEFETLM